MFISDSQVVIIIAMQFCVGGAIGAIVAAGLLRSKITRRFILVTAISTGVALNLIIGLWTWTDTNAEKGTATTFVDGHALQSFSPQL